MTLDKYRKEKAHEYSEVKKIIKGLTFNSMMGLKEKWFTNINSTEHFFEGIYKGIRVLIYRNRLGNCGLNGIYFDANKMFKYYSSNLIKFVKYKET